MNNFQIKNSIKIFTPPIFFKALQYLKASYKFKNFQSLVKKNRELENSHATDRCFILGSAPSINLLDLKPLKNEIIFALNNFFVHPDFSEIMSGEKKKYFLTAPLHPPQTREEWTNWVVAMSKDMPENANMVFGLNSSPVNIWQIIEKNKLFARQNKYFYYAGKNFEPEDQFDNRFIDLCSRIWTAGAVSVYALTVAIYMGFKEIYLLGIDHDHFLYTNPDKMRMYKDGIHQKNEIERTSGNNFHVKVFKGIYRSFSQYKMLGDNFHGKIFNASPKGILNLFPRVAYDELFKK
jgi:hypothetical protein